ncbi:MAG: DUF427 domain-containing protein [Myxococcota bacterium]
MADFLESNGMIDAAREKWDYRGQRRPDFAEAPGLGQESVWDYPRPPRIIADPRRVEVRFGTRVIAATTRAVRVLETASPPTFYVPPEDVDIAALVPSGRRSLCEWKGEAVDFDLVDGPGSVAWCYPRVFPEFAGIAGWFAFYPSRLECFVADERARPQPGGYYGGWLTEEIVGPVKGEPGITG